MTSDQIDDLPSALRCIVYSSTQPHGLSQAALVALAAAAAAYNAAHGITGQLLHMPPYCLHVLEGPAEPVENLFAAIQADPRHHGLRLVLRQDVRHRAFPDWAMAWVNDASSLAGQTTAPPARVVTAPGFSELDVLLDMPASGGETELRRPIHQDRARRTVDRIFETARRLWQRGGPHAVTLPALLQHAAITEPTFYRYFNSLDDVLRVTVLRIALRRVAEWTVVLQTTAFVSEQHMADVLADYGTRNFLRMRHVPEGLMQAILPHVHAVIPRLSTELAPKVLAAMTRCELPMAGRLDEPVVAAILAGLLGAAVSLAGSSMDQLRAPAARQAGIAIFLAGLHAYAHPPAASAAGRAGGRL